MKSLKGTKTAENLLKAFAGESQARNRYTYYAQIAKEEGYIQISEIFLETARNEKEHAERFFSFLKHDFHGENLIIHEAGFPTGIGTTVENLKYAAQGENEEWTVLYPSFGDEAETEGFKEISNCFRMIAKVEVHHEERFLKLLENINEEIVFQRPEEVEWKCENCGYIHKGKKAPAICPSCLFKQEYFEIRCVNY